MDLAGEEAGAEAVVVALAGVADLDGVAASDGAGKKPKATVAESDSRRDHALNTSSPPYD